MAIGYHLEQKMDLRSAVAMHLDNHRAEFEEFIISTSDKTFEEYHYAIQIPGTWGDHIEILILMHVLDRPIVVLDKEGKFRNYADASKAMECCTGEPIFLYYNADAHTEGNHYDTFIWQPHSTLSRKEVLLQLISSENESRLQPKTSSILSGGRGTLFEPKLNSNPNHNPQNGGASIEEQEVAQNGFGFNGC